MKEETKFSKFLETKILLRYANDTVSSSNETESEQQEQESFSIQDVIQAPKSELIQYIFKIMAADEEHKMTEEEEIKRS